MVVCHVKAGQGEKADGFLFESTVKATNAELIAEVVEVWNLRVRVKMLVNSIRQLAEYGPMKPPNKQVRSMRALMRAVWRGVLAPLPS